jgi:O-antigen/teichoic acid export membrane protein
VAFPAYAELAKAGKPIAPAFLTGVRMIMVLTAPLYIGVSLVAGPLVETMFGPKWLGMIPILSGLALAMPAMALQICCSPATTALGSAGSYLLTNAAGAVIMPICFLIGVTYGASGLVASWQVAAPLLLLVTLAVTLPKIGARWIDLIVSLVPVLLCCAVMAAVVALLRPHTAELAAPARLALLSLSGAAAYLATLLLGWPEVIRQARAMVSRKGPGASREQPGAA